MSEYLNYWPPIFSVFAFLKTGIFFMTCILPSASLELKKTIKMKDISFMEVKHYFQYEGKETGAE